MKRQHGYTSKEVMTVLAIVFILIPVLLLIGPVITIAAVNVFLKVFGVATIPYNLATILATLWLILVLSSKNTIKTKEKKKS